MALDTSKFKQNPLAASNASMVKLQAESVKQQMVSNHLLSDLVSIQSQQLKLQKQQMLLDKKKIQASKFSRQEASIERMSSGVSKSVKGPKKKGKVNPKDLLKLLGLGALVGGTAAIAANSDAILGLIANTLDNVAGSIDNAEKKLREFGERAKKTYGQLRNLATPIDGFSAFGIGNMAMGVTTAKKMTALKDGAKVRAAIGRGVSGAVGGTSELIGKGVRKTKDAIQGGIKSATPGVTRALDSVDDLAKTPTAATKITPGRIFGRIREGLQPMGVDPSKSVAARFQRLVGAGGAAQGRVANTANAIKQQSQLFMQGITGANNATVLSTAGRPFPNVARGAGALGDEAGGFFRAGRGIRTGVQNIASGKALRDLTSNLGKLKAKSITSLSNVFKALPGQIGAMGKASAQLGKNIKTAIANFDLGKAGVQLGKVATRGGVAGVRGAGKVLGAAPGAVKAVGGALGKTGGGLVKAAKLGGAGLKRVPLIGSLLSAGFGAMEANEEEIARLMQENNMSREQVQAGLADGSLQKDKGKIVARSAGAGIGAGAGAVVGGILGSALGPIGTALGAAAGSWLGENIGKFFAEPFAKIFKGFDFGKTFGPLVDTFKTMTSGIGEAFGQIFAAFGGGEGGGDSEGFIGAIKKAGEVTAVLAKLSLKLLVPTLQLVMKGIELLVGGIKNLIVGAVNGIKGMIDGVMNLPFIGDQIRGALERGGGFLKAINEFADQDLSIKSDAFGTGGGQLPATGVGGGGGKPILTSGRGMRWGKMHQGIDIGFAGDRGGQPMYLPRGAVITDARAEGRGDAGYGNSVYFTTDDGVTHLYAHMQRPTKLRIGQSYKKGTFVGKLGNTGRSTAPHLHWETSKNEADVGRGGPGLKDPRKFGYSLNSPFSSTGSAGVSSSMNYGERSALTPTVAAASGNPISNTLRNMSGSVRGLQEQLNRRTGLQGDTGDKMDLQAELLKALGVMSGGTTAATTASASNAGDGGTPVATGTVAMFPTASPVRDGGHVFEVVN